MQPSLEEETFINSRLGRSETCAHARTGLAMHFVTFEKFSWLLLKHLPLKFSRSSFNSICHKTIQGNSQMLNYFEIS